MKITDKAIAILNKMSPEEADRHLKSVKIAIKAISEHLSSLESKKDSKNTKDLRKELASMKELVAFIESKD